MQSRFEDRESARASRTRWSSPVSQIRCATRIGKTSRRLHRYSQLRPRRLRLYSFLGLRRRSFPAFEAAGLRQLLILPDAIAKNLFSTRDRVFAPKASAPAHHGHQHRGSDAAAFALPSSGGIISARPHKTKRVARLNVTSGNRVLPNV